MDWNLAIERNREALKRILAALVAMAGLAIGQSPSQWGRSPRNLPRHLHLAILRLLRPAESAARRLIVVAARGLVVTLPPSRPRKSKPDPHVAHAVLRGLGIAVVLSPADVARAAADRRAAAKRAAARAARPPVLPLLDPLRRPFRGRVRTVPPHAAPRILSFDGAAPYRLPPPSPYGPIRATRLARRFAALAAALDDLPAQARRFARWQARRAGNLAPSLPSTGRVPREARRVGCAAVRRVWPLRLGRPPGQRSARSRRPAHEVDEVLADLHHFALYALNHPDTS